MDGSRSCKEADLLALDKHSRRSRLVFYSHTANLLPTFADASRVLQKERRHHLQQDPDPLIDEDEQMEEEGSGRDVLGDMEIVARIMIPGGDEREDVRLTRAARLLIRNAIFLDAKTVNEAGRLQVLTQDVVQALQTMGHDETLPEQRRNRASEMSDGLALFYSGLAGYFINRPGRSWPATDLTLLEMGILAPKGCDDQLILA